jgi:hypothetical protein
MMLLSEVRSQFAQRSWGDSETFEIVGRSGKRYQVETEAFWDAEDEGPLRVFTLIDDDGWQVFAPMSESFILAPDGSFVAE